MAFLSSNKFKDLLKTFFCESLFLQPTLDNEL